MAKNEILWDKNRPKPNFNATLCKGTNFGSMAYNLFVGSSTLFHNIATSTLWEVTNNHYKEEKGVIGMTHRCSNEIFYTEEEFKKAKIDAPLSLCLIFALALFLEKKLKVSDKKIIKKRPTEINTLVSPSITNSYNELKKKPKEQSIKIEKKQNKGKKGILKKATKLV